jgi:hypothetical protein
MNTSSRRRRRIRRERRCSSNSNGLRPHVRFPNAGAGEVTSVGYLLRLELPPAASTVIGDDLLEHRG